MHASFHTQDVEHSAGAQIALSTDKSTVLMNRMRYFIFPSVDFISQSLCRYPSLSLHGIEGAFSAPGAKTVIPASVTGKFSIRLVSPSIPRPHCVLPDYVLWQVPDQTPDNINPLVEKYLKAEFAKLRSKNLFELEALHGGKPWVADVNHWNYRAAAKATEVRFLADPACLPDGQTQAVYKRTPDLTREGGSIPVTLTFAEALGVNVLLLPMGRGDDGAQCVPSFDFARYVATDD